ncbi:MAG: ABC transporter ATP-binding protein [Chromatiales bacterium]|nr:ABC transporter ATP-binding protein [Chromatiales bacterium]
MIELRSVSKAYRAGNGLRVVLDDVSVVFPTGVSVGILGLNGAGKSTLLRIIGGVEPPDRGTVRRDVRISWPIGFSGGLHTTMTGRENVQFIARIYGAPVRRVERFAEAFAELGVYFDMPVRTYSSGMRARLAFAVSMAAEFDCYLVDEVMAVGDARFNARYRRAFKARREGASVIMVSHNPQTIIEECDIAAVLSRGKLEMYSSVDAAMTAYRALLST